MYDYIIVRGRVGGGGFGGAFERRCGLPCAVARSRTELQGSRITTGDALCQSHTDHH